MLHFFGFEMLRLKKNTNLLILLIIGLFNWACSEKPDFSNTLTIAIAQYPETFDPRFTRTAIEGKVSRLIYRGLLRYDKNLALVGDLAKNFSQKDSLTLEFELYPDLRFSDGSVLNAKDVKASILALKDPKVGSFKRADYQIIERIEILSETRLFIKLKKPHAPAYHLFTQPIVKASSAFVARDQFLPIGAGPFVLEKAILGQSLVLKPRAGQTKLKPQQRIRFEVVREDNVRALGLLKGDYQLVQNLIGPPIIPALLKKNLNLSFLHERGSNFNYLGINLKNEHLKKTKVRQAIAYALGRDAVIDHQLFGMARPASSLLPPLHWAHHPDLKPYKPNLKKAKALLKSAGYQTAQNPIKLSIKVTTDRTRRQIAQIFARDLAQIGIDIEVKTYEWGTLYRDMRTGNFDLFIASWVGISDPDIYYNIFHSKMRPPLGLNRGFYKNLIIDELTLKARSEMNRAKQAKIYHHIQKIIFKDLAYIPLWFEDNWIVYDKRIQGYQLDLNASFGGLTEVIF